LFDAASFYIFWVRSQRRHECNCHERPG